jgi:O-6-methylguanine DNA methyltransferase
MSMLRKIIKLWESGREKDVGNMDNLEKQVKKGVIKRQMTFSQKVWALTSRIPPGKVTTYKTLAGMLRCGSCRAVGQALNRNPYAPEVPCHRVVGSDGRLVGYAGGLKRKVELLKSEGVRIENNRVVPELFWTGGKTGIERGRTL